MGSQLSWTGQSAAPLATAPVGLQRRSFSWVPVRRRYGPPLLPARSAQVLSCVQQGSRVGGLASCRGICFDLISEGVGRGVAATALG